MRLTTTQRIFLLCYRNLFDTFGMVVLEAMAVGLPVIVSPNVGAKDIVQENVNGYVLPAHQDVDAAADRIARLSNMEQREVMGAAAAQTAAMHDWERLAEEMAQIYRAMFSEKQGEAARKSRLEPESHAGRVGVSSEGKQ